MPFISFLLISFDFISLHFIPFRLAALRTDKFLNCKAAFWNVFSSASTGGPPKMQTEGLKAAKSVKESTGRSGPKSKKTVKI